MMRVVLAYTAGVMVAFVLGTAIGTQMVLHSVQSMGLTVSWSARLAATGNDFVELSASLLPLMALFLIAGWALAEWLSRRVSRYRHATTFVLTGAACILILHPLLNLLLFGIDPFAPARTWVGLVAQGCAGAVGGLCFSRVRWAPVDPVRAA